MNLNVDILCEYGSINGGENSLLVLLPLLRNLGISFRFIAPSAGPFVETIREAGFELVPFESRPGETLSRRRERLAELLKRSRPGLLHANSLSMGRLSGPVAHEIGLPSVSHLRDIIKLNRTAIDDLNRHRRLLAVSEATRRFHVAQGLDETRCHVMYNGIDLERFKPRRATGFFHRELGIPASSKLLGVIGQIGLRKGQDRLLDVLRPLFARSHDIRLVVVGQRWSEKEESVRYEENLRRDAESDPFRDRVHFVGVRNDIDRLLNEFTILVHPARQEPLGRVLLEAAASGLCVAATDVGGTREIFADPPSNQPAARLVSERHFETIADEIEFLLENEPFRTELADIARRRMETLFSMQRAADALFAHYCASDKK